MVDGGSVFVCVEIGEGSSDVDKNIDAKLVDVSAKKRIYLFIKMVKKLDISSYGFMF